MTDHDFFAAMAVGIPPITPPGAIPMTQLKAFYVDDMPTIYAAATPEEAARLYEEDMGEPCDDGYPREVSAAELDRSIPEFGEDEQPTGEMTTMRTWLEEASPGFLCGAE
ncbi:hypothetical protein [Stenotrophomonas maltophilia]|uniref:hypothetical protein n=1 Tax=Stenotrophomonas maltophilia TaxID=40324 RepID=UPI000DA8EC63|nr:hypothetical protein [Stenotrophomonas maltophilia]PZT05481.1 hypothetical protein A7X91_01910 [Stenotrophomonas maltophilia]